jgi:hypothetical protein
MSRAERQPLLSSLDRSRIRCTLVGSDLLGWLALLRSSQLWRRGTENCRLPKAAALSRWFWRLSRWQKQAYRRQPLQLQEKRRNLLSVLKVGRFGLTHLLDTSSSRITEHGDCISVDIRGPTLRSTVQETKMEPNDLTATFFPFASMSRMPQLPLQNGNGEFSFSSSR